MKPTYKAAQVAQFMATEALQEDSARLRFKNFVGAGYIITRQRSATDARGTLLFSLGDVATANILSQLVDLGGLSREAMQAAALRLQGWIIGEVPEGTKSPESPAQWMIDTLEENPTVAPGFSMAIHWARLPGGSVTCIAVITHGEFGTIGQGADENSVGSYPHRCTDPAA